MKKNATLTIVKLCLLAFIVIAALFSLPVVPGMASWYSHNSPGIRPTTANNEKFNDQEMTCAMWGMPFDARLLVININNGKSVLVRVNDRGPHKRFVQQGRVIDLTKAAFERVASPREGLAYVVVIRVF